MCLIFFAYKQHSDFPLILAANRDEFYARPTAPLAFWEDAPNVLAGRDLLKGGTWLGVTRSGRFAAVTNFRDANQRQLDSQSRGLLVSDYLCGLDSPLSYLKMLRSRAHKFTGFNLLVGDHQELFYFANREMKIARLDPGIYGLSNRLLNTPWPKVERGKRMFQAEINRHTIQSESIFSILTDRHRPADDCLPYTGVSLEWERILSSIFISSDDYGTRSSTILLLKRDATVTMAERLYLDSQKDMKTTEYVFKMRSGNERDRL